MLCVAAYQNHAACTVYCSHCCYLVSLQTSRSHATAFVCTMQQTHPIILDLYRLDIVLMIMFSQSHRDNAKHLYVLSMCAIQVLQYTHIYIYAYGAACWAVLARSVQFWRWQKSSIRFSSFNRWNDSVLTEVPCTGNSGVTIRNTDDGDGEKIPKRGHWLVSVYCKEFFRRSR